VDSVGYGINVNKKKLKEEYLGLGKKIGELRKQGIEIYNHVVNH